MCLDSFSMGKYHKTNLLKLSGVTIEDIKFSQDESKVLLIAGQYSSSAPKVKRAFLASYDISSSKTTVATKSELDPVTKKTKTYQEVTHELVLKKDFYQVLSSQSLNLSTCSKVFEISLIYHNPNFIVTCAD